MHCEECGLILDGVTDEQIVKASKYARIKAYCPVHADLILNYLVQ